jgi:hypothetical protein
MRNKISLEVVVSKDDIRFLPFEQTISYNKHRQDSSSEGGALAEHSVALSQGNKLSGLRLSLTAQSTQCIFFNIEQSSFTNCFFAGAHSSERFSPMCFTGQFSSLEMSIISA